MKKKYSKFITSLKSKNIKLYFLNTNNLIKIKKKKNTKFLKKKTCQNIQNILILN